MSHTVAGSAPSPDYSGEFGQDRNVRIFPSLFPFFHPVFENVFICDFFSGLEDGFFSQEFNGQLFIPIPVVKSRGFGIGRYGQSLGMETRGGRKLVTPREAR